MTPHEACKRIAVLCTEREFESRNSVSRLFDGSPVPSFLMVHELRSILADVVEDAAIPVGAEEASEIAYIIRSFVTDRVKGDVWSHRMNRGRLEALAERLESGR